MGRLDREVVDAHLVALEETVVVLRQLSEGNAGAPGGDTPGLWAICHGLQLAIQNVLDVAAHMAASLGAGAPDDYRSAILALGELGVVDPASAETMAPMAGLRNILVHGYLRLDLDRVAAALRRLDDFARFAEDVRTFLTANPDL